MAFAINFMYTTQPIKGDVLPMEGTPVANHQTTSTQTVPEGCNYVTISTDGAHTISFNDGTYSLVGSQFQNKTFRTLVAGNFSFPVAVGTVITVA